MLFLFIFILVFHFRFHISFSFFIFNFSFSLFMLFLSSHHLFDTSHRSFMIMNRLRFVLTSVLHKIASHIPYHTVISRTLYTLLNGIMCGFNSVGEKNGVGDCSSEKPVNFTQSGRSRVLVRVLVKGNKRVDVDLKIEIRDVSLIV